MNADPWVSATKTRIREVQAMLLQTAELGRLAAADPDTMAALLEPYEELMETLYERDLPLAKLADQADLLLRVSGPAASAPAPRVSVVTRLLTSTRDQVTGLAMLLDGVGAARVPRALDMGFVGSAPGSLFLGFSAEPDAEGEATRGAVRALADASRLVSEERPIETLAEHIPDPAARDMALAAVRQLSPSGQIGIREIDLFGRQVETPTVLTTETRRQARVILAQRLPQTGTPVTFVGTVREIDLDASRFVVRNLDGGLDVTSIRCAHQFDESDAKGLVDCRVRVHGPAELNKKGQVRLVWVDELEVLD